MQRQLFTCSRGGFHGLELLAPAWRWYYPVITCDGNVAEGIKAFQTMKLIMTLMNLLLEN